MMSVTRLNTIVPFVLPRHAMLSRGKSDRSIRFSRMASSMSRPIYAIVSAIRTTQPSSVIGIRRVWECSFLSASSRSNVSKDLSLLGRNIWLWISPSWHKIPSSVCRLRFHPNPLRSTLSRNWTLWTLWWNAPIPWFRHNFARQRSPSWPKGAWPISWPRAMASIKSSFKLRYRPMVRAIFETNWTCSTRWVMWSFLIRENTCVLSM